MMARIKDGLMFVLAATFSIASFSARFSLTEFDATEPEANLQYLPIVGRLSSNMVSKGSQLDISGYGADNITPVRGCTMLVTTGLTGPVYKV